MKKIVSDKDELIAQDAVDIDAFKKLAVENAKAFSDKEQQFIAASAEKDVEIEALKKKCSNLSAKLASEIYALEQTVDSKQRLLDETISKSATEIEFMKICANEKEQQLSEALAMKSVELESLRKAKDEMEAELSESAISKKIASESDLMIQVRTRFCFLFFSHLCFTFRLCFAARRCTCSS